jgi:hypothetical protein
MTADTIVTSKVMEHKERTSSNPIILSFTFFIIIGGRKVVGPVSTERLEVNKSELEEERKEGKECVGG